MSPSLTAPQRGGWRCARAPRTVPYPSPLHPNSPPITRASRSSTHVFSLPARDVVRTCSRVQDLGWPKQCAVVRAGDSAKQCAVVRAGVSAKGRMLIRRLHPHSGNQFCIPLQRDGLYNRHNVFKVKDILWTLSVSSTPSSWISQVSKSEVDGIKDLSLLRYQEPPEMFHQWHPKGGVQWWYVGCVSREA